MAAKDFERIAIKHRDGKCRIDTCYLCAYFLYNFRKLKVREMPTKRKGYL